LEEVASMLGGLIPPHTASTTDDTTLTPEDIDILLSESNTHDIPLDDNVSADIHHINLDSTGRQQFMAGGSQNSLNISATGGIPIVTTQPPVLIRHSISDEELSMFVNLGKGGFSDFMWICVGAVIGLIAPTFEKIYHAIFADEKIPLNALGIIEIIVFTIAITGAIITKIVSKDRKNTVERLAEEIRGREGHKSN